MQSVNIPSSHGSFAWPVAGAFGAAANGWGVQAEQPEGFEPTPGADPQAEAPVEVPTEAAPEEVTDDAGSVEQGQELSDSGE